MIWAIALALGLFGVCGFVHFVLIRYVHDRIVHLSFGRSGRMLLGFYAAGLAHLIEAGLYAAGFWFGRGAGLGGLNSIDGPVGVMETYYFSLVNYTSLGLGDIYPTGHLRFLAGIESLNGFLLISCSAAFIFLLMTGPGDKVRCCCAKSISDHDCQMDNCCSGHGLQA